MLRDIKNAHLHPFVLPFQVTTTSDPSASLDVGSADATVTRLSDGDAEITFGRKFSREPVIVGGVGAGVTDGGYLYLYVDPTTSSINPGAVDSTNSGVDGTFDLMVFGYYSTDTNRYKYLPVHTSKDRCRFLAFNVNGTGTAAITRGKYDATLTDHGTGHYTLTFRKPFSRTPVVTVTGEGTSMVTCKVSAKSNTAITIKTFDASAAATDAKFNVFVLGQDSTDERGGMRCLLQGTQRKPRFEIFRIESNGAETIGGTDCSITVNGTGDYTVTFTKSFGLSPVACALTIGGNCATIHSVSTTAVRVLAHTHAGVALNCDFNLVVYGSDDIVEY